MKESELYHLQPKTVEALVHWYSTDSRTMPWRESRDPYRIWISEIMLQQTQVVTVIPYYERWMERFPDVRSIAEAEEDDLLKHWEGLGYYSRAHNLKRGAEYIMERLAGQLPEDYESWLKVPGVGPYTAAAVSSISFSEKQGVVDGNVKRVMARLFEIHSSPGSADFHKTCRTLIEKSFFDHDPGQINQAWMELGATVCMPRPHCFRCPLSTVCEAYMHNRMTEFPVKKRRKKIPQREGAMFVIRNSAGEFLMVKRRKGSLLQGLWEFPNTYYDEMPLWDFTLANDIELRHDYIEKVQHQYSHFSVNFQLYEAELRSSWWNDYWDEFKWVSGELLKDLPRPGIQIKAMRIAGLD